MAWCISWYCNLNSTGKYKSGALSTERFSFSKTVSVHKSFNRVKLYHYYILIILCQFTNRTLKFAAVINKKKWFSFIWFSSSLNLFVQSNTFSTGFVQFIKFYWFFQLFLNTSINLWIINSFYWNTIKNPTFWAQIVSNHNRS